MCFHLDRPSPQVLVEYLYKVKALSRLVDSILPLRDHFLLDPPSQQSLALVSNRLRTADFLRPAFAPASVSFLSTSRPFPSAPLALQFDVPAPVLVGGFRQFLGSTLLASCAFG